MQHVVGFIGKSLRVESEMCAVPSLTLKVIMLSTVTLVFSFTLGVPELEGLLCDATYTYSAMSTPALT